MNPDKAKLFAQYYGQHILILAEGEEFPYRISHGSIEIDGEISYIKLKSLEDITDDDFYEIALANYEFQPFYNKGMIKPQQLNALQIDFLRSKGYAVPFMKYSVYDLENNGWVKIIKN
jgi:hypothetical protein